MDVAALTPTILDILDVVQPLDAAVSYQVYAAAFGFDVATSGYTFDIATAASPAVAETITAGQGLHCHIANADFPANLIYCAGIAMFLKAGAADPVLCQIDILDPAKDFDAIIVSEPHPAALSFTAAVLAAATVTDDTGSRDPKACTFRLLGPTIDGVGMTYNVDGPTVNLDSGTPFQVPVSRQPTLDFQVAENSARNFVAANNGIFTRFTPSGTIVIDTSRQSIASAMALILGNTVVKMVMPVDSEGISETKYLYSMTRGNSGASSVRWGKSAVPTVQFNMPSAVQDKLLRNIHCEVTRRYKAS